MMRVKLDHITSIAFGTIDDAIREATASSSATMNTYIENGTLLELVTESHSVTYMPDKLMYCVCHMVAIKVSIP